MFGYMRRQGVDTPIPISYNQYRSGSRMQYSCRSCWYSAETLNDYMWRTNEYVTSDTANVYTCTVTPAPPPPPPSPPRPPSPPPQYTWSSWCTNCQQPYSNTLYKTGYGMSSCQTYAQQNGRSYAGVRYAYGRYYCVVGDNCCSGGSGYSVKRGYLGG